MKQAGTTRQPASTSTRRMSLILSLDVERARVDPRELALCHLGAQVTQVGGEMVRDHRDLDTDGTRGERDVDRAAIVRGCQGRDRTAGGDVEHGRADGRSWQARIEVAHGRW